MPSHRVAEISAQRILRGSMNALLVSIFAFAIVTLWNSWETVYIQPDSYGYLIPVAKAVFEGGWDHAYARPFAYPAFVYAALREGDSLNAVVAAQIALYVGGALVLYLVVRTPAIAARRSNQSTTGIDLVSQGAAVSMVALYFGLSNHYFSSAFYLGPEMVSSVFALCGLYAALQLLVAQDLSRARRVTLSIAASIFAALLVGMKPSYVAFAVLLVVTSTLGLVRQRPSNSKPLITIVVLTVLAMPASVLLFDNALAQKYGDSDAVLFGPRTAFCNNAHVIAPVLESHSSETLRILGADGAARTAALLRDVQAQGNWPLLGFDGDYCMYTISARRQELENQHFGRDTDSVAATYRRLLGASIVENPLGFAQRVGRQLGKFLWSRFPVDCEKQTRVDAGRGTPQVERLIAERSTPQVSVELRSAPLSSLICPPLEWTAGAIHASLLISALLVTLSRRLRSESTVNQASPIELGLILCLFAWLSSGLVVALVHTFDIYRYVSATLPLFLATLGLSATIVVGWAMNVPSLLGSNGK